MASSLFAAGISEDRDWLGRGEWLDAMMAMVNDQNQSEGDIAVKAYQKERAELMFRTQIIIQEEDAETFRNRGRTTTPKHQATTNPASEKIAPQALTTDQEIKMANTKSHS